MKTITEHLDDLDRMVDAGNTSKHELRSQIAFIQRQVAALESDHHAAIDGNAKLRMAQEERDAKILNLESELAEAQRPQSPMMSASLHK